MEVRAKPKHFEYCRQIAEINTIERFINHPIYGVAYEVEVLMARPGTDVECWHRTNILPSTLAKVFISALNSVMHLKVSITSPLCGSSLAGLQLSGLQN